MSNCKIYLENYSGTYYPGGEIRGRIECCFDDETTVRGIKIRLKCKEHNEWTGTQSYTDAHRKRRTRHITLTGDRNILYNEKMLFGSGSGSQVLSRGKHVYPFSYILPHDIPSSFNGPYGGIHYKLKAVVDRPMRFDYEDIFNFTVVSPIDFNMMSQDLQKATTYSDDKTICCCCCNGGDLTMDVQLPKHAFVPGEVINLRVTVSNLSNSNVERLIVKLMKTVKYRVESPHSESKSDVEQVIAMSEHGVGAHGEYTYDLQLAIPEYLEVPNFKNCELFQVHYQLDVSCKLPSCTMDLDISVGNIEMGHIQYTGGNSITQQDSLTPGVIINPPPMDGTYPPVLPNAPPGGGDYPPPPGPQYPPPAGGSYPPPPGGNYPSPGSGYPPPGGSYPSPPAGSYPPSSGATYPPGSPPAYPNHSFEKPVYPGGQPNAPTSSIANAPVDDNPRAREAASSTPSAPYGSLFEQPPPSYNQVQQQNANAPYPPQ